MKTLHILSHVLLYKKLQKHTLSEHRPKVLHPKYVPKNSIKPITFVAFGQIWVVISVLNIFAILLYHPVGFS